MIVGGIRGGDFSKATRYINILDASRHVKNVVHADIVLNTPFAIIRTLFTNSFQKTNYPDLTPELILQKVQPIKQYHNNPPTKPNVVIFILESYGREYIGAFNKKSGIPDYQSRTIHRFARAAQYDFHERLCQRKTIHTRNVVYFGGIAIV
jgi:hypothetical protein